MEDILSWFDLQKSEVVHKPMLWQEMKIQVIMGSNSFKHL